MAKNDRTTAGPYWTRNWIEKMWRFTAENFVDFDTGAVDFEALGREEYEFRKALFYRKFKNSERAREAFVESEDLYKVNVERGKKGGRPRKNQETTADAPTREDGEFKSDSGDAGNLESATSANIYGVAPHREAGDVSATESNNSEARESRRTGADSLRSDCHSAPVRSLPMPSKEQLYDFARAESLDEADARDWYEMTVVDRSGNDREGKPITNWKAALKRFCKSRADRRTA